MKKDCKPFVVLIVNQIKRLFPELEIVGIKRKDEDWYCVMFNDYDAYSDKTFKEYLKEFRIKYKNHPIIYGYCSKVESLETEWTYSKP